MKLQIQKRIHAILYFAGKSNDNRINRLKLVKLLWLADRIHLNRYGRMILKDDYYALSHGPVPSKTMDLSEVDVPDVYSVKGYVIEAEEKFDPKYFSESDLEVMNEVWDTYGGMTKYVLKDYSHLFPEWKRFEDQLNDENQPNRFRMKLDDFFIDPDAEANFNIDEEKRNVSKEYFNHRNSIQEVIE